jgi:hypothetical protein
MSLAEDSLWAPVADFDTSGPVMLRTRGGRRFLVRASQRFLGVSLSVAALGLWLVPVGAGGTAEVLSKLMVTLLLGFAGAALWQAGSPRPMPEIEIDLVRREVRLVRFYGETRSLVTRRRFEDLSGAAFRGRDVQLWDEAGELLAELTLPDDALTAALRRALQDAQVAPRARAA